MNSLKRRFITLGLTFLYLGFWLITAAQPSISLSAPGISMQNYAPLKVGDTVPNVFFRHLINYPVKTASLKAFQGKFLLLDFWSIYCSSCVEGFPKMMALQKHFAEKLQIILVNPWQREQTVRELFEKRHRVTRTPIDLPADCGDTFLLKLFPVDGVPHLVWIDQRGIVRSITFEDPATESNLSRMIQGEEVQLHQKTNFHLDADYHKPLFVQGNGGNGEGILWSSVLSKNVNGIYPALDVVPDSMHRASIYSSVAAPQDLYEGAYSNQRDFYGHFIALRHSYVVRDIKDTSRFTAMVDGELNWDDLFVYQLTAPTASTAQLQAWMQSDLQRYFGYRVHWETRNIPCLILTVDDTSMIKPKGDSSNSITSDIEVNWNNVSLPEMAKYLEVATNYFYSPYPIRYESSFTGLVGGIHFTTDVYNYKSLNKALEAYHIHFRLESRLIKMLVIQDPVSASLSLIEK